ncbi:MAG: DegT/DnrJ/EryC1/StrS family aminotransferase [Planktomarina sp.]|nr:DegT/DnrJ/EryC1/StrS family aminotransferase [Planktomarina sp.]
MATTKNFLPEQYRQSNKLGINHNYLDQQFSDHQVIWAKMRDVVIRGDFTLGSEVDLLEKEYAHISGTKHAIGVGSGTDAIFLSLKALGVGEGDEVITTAFTFYATIGAIVTAGAKPVFCDIGADYNINSLEIEAKITPATKAILPVHWSGKPCDMDAIEDIAQKHNLAIVGDACHAISATYKGRTAGSLGTLACFSFHPLKNLNVWGDGGIITTNSDELADKLRLMRNHGLVGRDECHMFAYNSRLDTIQAVVARHMLEKINHITESRVAHANYFDKELRSVPQIIIPKRDTDIYQVYHIYSICCQRRSELQNYLIENDVDAKVHYPIPMHLQPAADYLGHKKGDFPIAETIADNTISLPVHEFISRNQQDHVINLIKAFYD